MSPSKNSEMSIKAGADLLLKGWKMLNKACPVCVEPLYEKEGKVVCVKCKKEYIMVDSKSEIPQGKSAGVIQPAESSTPNDFSSYDFSKLPPALAETAKTMLAKITDLNTKLKETSDPKEIAEISSTIRSLIDSLRSLTS